MNELEVVNELTGIEIKHRFEQDTAEGQTKIVNGWLDVIKEYGKQQYEKGYNDAKNED